MELLKSYNRDLPPLSWIADIDLNARSVNADLGRSVHAGTTWFFEGAWAGAFDQIGFDRASAVAGSGLKITDDCVRLAAPTHMLEALYIHQAGRKRWIVSNSCSLLLARLGDRLGSNRFDYSHIFGDVRFGMDIASTRIPTQNGHVRRHFWRPVQISDAGLEILPRNDPPSFADFASYETYLIDVCRALIQNAGDQKRDAHYTPSTAVSSGYDSPAIAALLSKVGCDEAVTFAAARKQYGGDSDSGADIAGRLGMQVSVHDRHDYLSLPDCVEATFLASGAGNGQDVVFAALSDALERKIFFTGFHGDTVWGKTKTPASYLAGYNGYVAGASITEYRLDQDFIHVPLPFFGCQHFDAIHAISHHPDMQPWSVGGDYDRPIARRIAESEGVNRSGFGIKKKAITHVVARSDRPMSKPSETDLHRYRQAHECSSGEQSTLICLLFAAIFRPLQSLLYRHETYPLFVARWLFKAVSRVERFKPSNEKTSILYHWAFDRRIATYSQALMHRAAEGGLSDQSPKTERARRGLWYGSSRPAQRHPEYLQTVGNRD